MRLLLMILVGTLIFTFSWGWIMDVHYGHMNTDGYIHFYLIELQGIFQAFVDGAHKNFDLLFNPHQPLIRREFALPTV